MQTLEITNEKLEEIKIFPESELVEIAQNVKTLITTVQGTVFLDRELGLTTDLLDAPLNVLQARYTAKIADAVAKYEPRAKVTDCFFSGTLPDGKIKIKVRLLVK